MYARGASLLQYNKKPDDALSPSKLRLGLADRIKLARGSGAVAAVAAKLARSQLNTPWTVAPKGIRNAQMQAVRAAQSTLTRGASEITRGVGNVARKFKLW